MTRERTDLHPAERTRRRAIAAVRGATRGWPAARRPSLDDVRDAVGDVLATAVAGGWAERSGAWYYVKLRAIRALRGWQRVKGGKIYSCRSGATPAATPAMAGPDGEPQDPATWIDANLAGASPVDVAVSAAGRAWARDIAEPPGLPRRELEPATWERPEYAPPDPRELTAKAQERAGSGRALARALGVDPSSVGNWRRGAYRPSPEHVQAMRDLLRTCPPKRGPRAT